MDQQVKEVDVKPNKLAFQIALAFALYTVFLIFLFKLIGIDIEAENVPGATQFFSTVVSYVPFILGIFYVQKTYRKQLGGYMDFRKGFSAGFRVASAAGLFIGVFMIIYYKVLDRDAVAQLINNAISKAGNDPKKIREIHDMEPYMAVITSFMAAISFTILGIIISVISALILRSEQPSDLRR